MQGGWKRDSKACLAWLNGKSPKVCYYCTMSGEQSRRWYQCQLTEVPAIFLLGRHDTILEQVWILPKT